MVFAITTVSLSLSNNDTSVILFDGKGLLIGYDGFCVVSKYPDGKLIKKFITSKSVALTNLILAGNGASHIQIQMSKISIELNHMLYLNIRNHWQL